MGKLSYKKFETSEDFEKWQDENPDCVICTVSPIALTGEEFAQGNEATLDMDWGCFVVYKRHANS